jgi:hypothetical protein
MGRERRFNTLDDTPGEPTGVSAVFVRKMQRAEDGWLLRLSNKVIQLLEDGQNYLYCGKQLWDVSGSKAK